MKNNNKNIKGFTLIELIIVLAILGILAVVALQSMSAGNISKAQMTEGLNLGNSMKTAIGQHLAKYGDFPDNTASASGNIPVASSINGEYVKQTSTKNNKIMVEFKSKNDNAAITSELAGKKILLTGTSSGISTSWGCKTDVSLEVSPSSCEAGQSGLSLE